MIALSGLTIGQFDSVLFALKSQGMDVVDQIPPEIVDKRRRAIKLVEFVEQEDPSLEVLRQALPRQMAVQSTPVIWELPARNLLFTGRTEQLRALRTSLSAANPFSIASQAICGPPGQGKSQLALEYVHQNIASYRAIFWFGGGEDQSLQHHYAQIAKTQGLSGSDEEENRRAVFRWLQGHSPWLIVVDNLAPSYLMRADRADALPLPQQGGHILITTRAADCGALGINQPLQLEEFSMAEANVFLCHRLNRNFAELSEDARHAMEELAKALHRVPLALEQACFLMQKHVKDYAALLPQARGELFSLLSYAVPAKVYHGLALTAVYERLRKELEKRSPGSIELLRIAAMMGTEPIPSAIFQYGAEEMVTELAVPLADAKTHSAALAELLEPLLQNSLLQRAPNDTFILNRLVRLLIQNMPDERRLGVFGERAIRAVNRAFAVVQLPPDVRLRMLPHIAQVTRLLEQGRCAAEKAQLTHNAARLLIEQGQKERAAAWLQRSIEISNELLHRGQLAIAHTLLDLSELEMDRDNPLGSALQARKALSFIYNPQSPSKLEQDPGQPSVLDQIALYERSIALFEKLSDSTGLLQGLDGLAELYGRKEDFDSARAMVERAIGLRKKLLGQRHPEVATCLSYLATLYRKLGHNDRAESLLRETLVIWEQALGSEDPQLLPYLAELAELLRERGCLEEANALLERVTLIKKKCGLA